MSTPHAVTLLNVPLHCLSESEVMQRVESAIDANEPMRVGVVNAAKMVAMQRDAVLFDDVSSSDLVLADGMSVVWASRLLGYSAVHRIAGIDLMFRLFELAARRHFRVYCLGATEEISIEVARNLERDYPGLVLAGRRNGYFSDEEAQEVAREIADCHPDILLVAITSPRKELFMARWADTINAKVTHGVGGSFDVYAGKVDRAPVSWQKLGLEWLYRVKQEPRRLWKRYATTNLLFTWLIALEWLRKLNPLRNRR